MSNDNGKNQFPVRHIGYHLALCGRSVRDPTTNIVRQDLGVDRYRRMGVTKAGRYKNEAPYRVCKLCIAAIEQRNSRWRKKERANRKARAHG